MYILFQERQLKTEEYQDLASSLLSWLMATTSMLEQRHFPSTLIEIKVMQIHFITMLEIV